MELHGRWNSDLSSYRDNNLNGEQNEMSEAPKGLRQTLADEANSEQTADNATEGFEYRIILHSGAVIEVLCKSEPTKLAVMWQKARAKDEVIAWNADQFTEARQVSHLEIVYDDSDADGEDEEDEGVTQASGTEEKTKKSATAGLSAAAGITTPPAQPVSAANG